MAGPRGKGVPGTWPQLLPHAGSVALVRPHARRDPHLWEPGGTPPPNGSPAGPRPLGARRTRVLPEQLLLLRFGSRTAGPNGDTRSGRLRLRGSCPEPRSPPRTDADPRELLLGLAAPDRLREALSCPPVLWREDPVSVPAPPAPERREHRGPRCALLPNGLRARGLGGRTGTKQDGFLAPPPRH